MATSQWRTLPALMALERYGHAAGVYKDGLYLVGGFGEDAINTSCERVDTKSHAITTLTSEMAIARLQLAVVVHGDKLYAIGGQDGDYATQKSVEVYDFVTEQWTTLPTEMQVARSHHVAVVHQNKIYVVGGEDDEDVPLTSTECFDIATQEWSMLPTQMRMGRQNHCAAVHGDKLFVLGGGGGFNTADTFAGDEVLDFITGEWSAFPVTMPAQMCNHAAVVHEDTLYVVGGREKAFTPTKSVQVYNILRQEWSTMAAEMTMQRHFHAVAISGNDMYAIGGWGSNAERTVEVHTLISSHAWSPGRHATFPVQFQKAVWLVLLCGVRTNQVPDDVLFCILSLLLRDDCAVDRARTEGMVEVIA